MAKSSVNPFFQQTFKNFDESIVSTLQISHLTQKIQSYIREIVGTTEALLGKDSINAVLLFGSASNMQNTKISDVDLMVLVNDSIDRRRIKEITPILTGIVIKHRYRNYSKVWHAKILHIIERSTGMFCSYFITKMSNWNRGNFSKIFSTNLILTHLLAPHKIVLDSMKMGTTLLYNAKSGEINLRSFQKSYTKSQLIKSLLLNLMMSIGTLFILPLNKKNSKYLLESIKWSIRCGDFYLNQEINSLSKIVEDYQNLGVNNQFLQKFLKYRKNLKEDLMFWIKVPYYILKIHLLTLKM
ncbi:MAG: hypothetical protein ACTSWX_14065 [Promethearchaeota archaeon]